MLDTEWTRHQFLLQMLGVQAKKTTYATSSEKKHLKYILEKKSTEVLFLLGVGAVSCISEILAWVEEKKAREVILLEESLEALNGFLDETNARLFS